MSQASEYAKHQHLFPKFGKSEIDCNCDDCNHELWDAEEHGEIMPEYFLKAMVRLQALRDAWGKPLVITSGHRCKAHNKRVGGASRSKHLMVAFDVVMPAEYQEIFSKTAVAVGFNGIGTYPTKGFVHLDDLREEFTTWEG